MRRLGAPNLIALGLEASTIESLERQADKDPQPTHQLGNLSAYVANGEARSACKRAFGAQLAVFTAASTG
jgi:hypothetical protein